MINDYKYQSSFLVLNINFFQLDSLQKNVT